MESTLQNLITNLPRMNEDSPASDYAGVDTAPQLGGAGGGLEVSGITTTTAQAQSEPIIGLAADAVSTTLAQPTVEVVALDSLESHPIAPFPSPPSQAIAEDELSPAGALTDVSLTAPSVNAPAVRERSPTGGLALDDVFGDGEATEDDRATIDYSSIIPSDLQPNFTPHCRQGYRNKESLALRWFEELEIAPHRVRKINVRESDSTRLTMLSIAKLLVLGGRVMPDKAGEYLHAEFEKFATGLSAGILSGKGRVSAAEDSFRQSFKRPTKADFPNVPYVMTGSQKTASIVESFALRPEPSAVVSTPEERAAFMAASLSIASEPSSLDAGTGTQASLPVAASDSMESLGAPLVAPVTLDAVSEGLAVERLSIAAASHTVTLEAHDHALTENRRLINAQAAEISQLSNSVKALISTVRTLESRIDKMRDEQAEDKTAVAALLDYTKAATTADAVRTVLSKVEALSYRLAAAEDTLSAIEPGPRDDPPPDELPTSEAKPVAALARQEPPMIDTVIVFKRNYTTYEGLEAEKTTKLNPPMSKRAFLDNYVKSLKTSGWVVTIEGSAASLVPQLFGIMVEFTPGSPRAFFLAKVDFPEARRLAMQLPDFKNQYLREERAPAECVNSRNIPAAQDAPYLIATQGTLEAIQRRARDIRRHFEIQTSDQEQAFDTIQTAYGNALSYIEPRNTSTGDLGHLLLGKMTKPESRAAVSKAISVLVNVFRSKRALAAFDLRMTQLKGNQHVARMQATLTTGPVCSVLEVLAAEFPARADNTPSLCDILPTLETYSKSRTRTSGTAAHASRDRSPHKNKPRS